MNTAPRLKRRVPPDFPPALKSGNSPAVKLELLVKSHPEIALRVHTRELTSKQFDYCCRKSPYSALQYASDRLTDHYLLEYCCRHEPWNALLFAAGQLTPELTDICCSQETEQLIQSAANWLTEEQFDCCCRKDPLAALLYGSDRLTPEVFEYCFKKHPVEAMRHAPKFLLLRHVRKLSREHINAVLDQLRGDSHPLLLEAFWKHRKCIHASIGEIVRQQIAACV